MLKRCLLSWTVTVFVVAAWLFGMSAAAQDITEQQALLTAQRFMQGKTFETVSASRRAARTADFANQHGYYVFNVENNGGYVIVSADERTERQILGYSNKGHFDYDVLPANAKAWMDGYTEGIRHLKSLPTNNHAEHINESTTDGKKVEPLCMSAWGQFAPYNNLCPEVNGKRCVTGCVVTATAQIMYKHKHPAKGTGSESYEWNGTTLSADFSQSTYQWNLMLDKYTEGSYTEEQGNAVALLMRDLGIASHMVYTTEASGAASENMPYSLWKHFGYDKNVLYLKRDCCSTEEFSTVMQKELDEGRPILMSGGDNGAHTYVCDGYDERGYFHINYGWDGQQDNYYLIGQNMPYSRAISILYGIQPDKGGKNGITGQSNKDFAWKEGDELTCALHVVNTIGTELIEVAVAAKNTATNDVQYFVMTQDGETSQCVNGSGIVWDKYKNFTFDKTLTDGKYQLYPVCRVKGEQNWQTFYFMEKCQRYVDLTVTNGTKTYANNHINDNLDEGKVEKDGIYYVLDEEKKEASVTFKNIHYASYKGEVTIPATITIGDKTYQVVEIGKDAFYESENLTSIAIGANIKTIQPAFYSCVRLKTVKFAQDSKLETIEKMAFQFCVSMESIELPEGLKKIDENAFNGCDELVRIVLPKSVAMIAEDAFSTNSKNLHMYVVWENPQTETEASNLNKSQDIKTWTLHVPKGAKEKYQQTAGWKEFGTILDDNTTGIETVSNSQQPTADGYYDLHGRRVEKPAKGIYIVNGKKVVIK